MGFDLEHFFEELMLDLKNKELGDRGKLLALEEYIREQYDYAKECGMF